MEELGKKGICLEVLDAEEFEVVVPHTVFEEGKLEVEVIAEFRNHPEEIYRTVEYRIMGGEWRKCVG